MTEQNTEQKTFSFRIPCELKKAQIFETRRQMGVPVTHLNFSCMVISSKIIGDQVEFELEKIGDLYVR